MSDKSDLYLLPWPVIWYIYNRQAIRQCYMDMTYDIMGKDGNVKTLPLFGDINIWTLKYTFSHPTGLLFHTICSDHSFGDREGLVWRYASFRKTAHSLIIHRANIPLLLLLLTSCPSLLSSTLFSMEASLWNALLSMILKIDWIMWCAPLIPATSQRLLQMLLSVVVDSITVHTCTRNCQQQCWGHCLLFIAFSLSHRTNNMFASVSS